MKLFFQTPLNKILNIEEKPVEQIGLILAIIILLIGVSFSPMRHTNDDSPNFVEEIACYFTTSVCVDVGRSINNKLEKIRVFKKVCSGSSRERCVEAGVELYDFDAAAAMQIFTNTCHDRIVAGCWLLGVRLEDINNLVEAEKAYRKAIEISPGHSAPAYIALGHLLESRNELNEAEEAYRKAIEIVPDSAIFPD